jgi:alpha-amylase/alpha-mannosidase (GH57 family)
LIIHGHFYQPPRENPWSGSIGRQPSAAPFLNWNERINRECYAPNARARLLDKQGAIARFINNFEYLSFNMGPTLLLWLKRSDPATYQLILEADQKTAQKRHGHGPAIAQVFNHIIMPLASLQDKLTQVLWGRAHFSQTFGRPPQGMWLAETAADKESLRLMAQAGIKFTILAQNQIDALRPLGSVQPWRRLETSPDPRQPYRIFWGSGATDYLDVFVYDGPVSRAVAFENLLRDGAIFKDRLAEAFGADQPGQPRLVNLATDGESYGHHFHFGDMTLAWLFNALENQPLNEPNPITLTTYSQYLSLFPPTSEARLVENSSWSCCHGVERWRSDCGCHTGGPANWNQKWRGPLRAGLNWLRDQLKTIFEMEGARLLKDPWGARNDYIEVILANFDERRRDDFLQRHSLEPTNNASRRKITRLLEAQRMSLYMFTSCAWFYDDLAGLEPIQNLRYAARAIELASDWAKSDLTEGLLFWLRQAHPNDPHYPTGEDVWRDQVVTAKLRPRQAMAHLAAAQLLDAPEALGEFVYWRSTVKNLKILEGQPGRLALGEAVMEDTRLLTAQTSYFIALLSSGQRLEILVCSSPDPLREARALWETTGAEAVGAWLAIPKTGAFLFEPQDLWPSVRQNLLSEQIHDFFTNLKKYAQKSFVEHQELLTIYHRPNSDNWLDQFIFRVMVEADLEKFTLAMAEGEPIDLARLAELIKKETTEDPTNVQLIRSAAEAYLTRLVDRLATNPRPTLLTEILQLIQLIAKSLPGADLWPSQNRWHSLWSDPHYSQALAPTERDQFIKIGLGLGFGERIF